MTAQRPVFVLTLRPEPGIDGLRALKALLKVALRAFGLRCVAITRAPSAHTPGLDRGEHGC